MFERLTAEWCSFGWCNPPKIHPIASKPRPGWAVHTVRRQS